MSKKKANDSVILEALEPRFMMSADLPGVDLLVQADETQDLEADAQDLLESAVSTFVEKQEQKNELIIVDSNVADYELLIEDIQNSADEDVHFNILLLNPEVDGVTQISQELSTQTNLDAIHIISHGNAGEIEIGNTVLDADSISQNETLINTWSASLNESADILIYGCDLTSTSEGEELVDTLAALTGADVAASDDRTGHESLGGDWDLEYEHGYIETEVAISESAQYSWQQTLDITTGLIGHWTFDTDATDSSGNNNNGIFNDNASIDTNAGTNKIGDGKLSLDGTTDYVQINSLLGKPSNVTLAAWVNLDAADTDGSEVISIGDYVVLRLDSSAGLRGHIVYGTGGSFDTVTYNTTLATTGWHHVAMTFNDTDKKLILYLDGEEKASTTLDPTHSIYYSDKGSVTRIGMNGDTSTNYDFNGLIDDARVYDRALSATDIIELSNTAPTDLQATSSTGGGVSINEDSGDDAYLIADDGGAILSGLSSFTVELDFSGADSTANHFLMSYATSTHNNTLMVVATSTNELNLHINNTFHTFSAIDLLDGEQHRLSISWDNTTGEAKVYIDGVLQDSTTGFQTGVVLNTDGTNALVFGQDQDSVDGGYDPAQNFRGTYYDVRIFDDVRSAAEIAANHLTTLPRDESGLLANWTFDDLSAYGIVTDTVSGNNLTVQHASGGSFTTSNSELSFAVDENVADGTVVGTVSGTDAEREALIDSLLGSDPTLVYSAETGKFYQAVNSTVKWNDANSDAQTALLNGVSGQLTVVQSATENQVVHQLAYDSGFYAVWLGGSDKDIEGDWRWYDGSSAGEQFWQGLADGYNVNNAYVNWDTNIGPEPNDSSDEDYLRMYTDGGARDRLWDDAQVTATHQYIVEWDADEVLDNAGPSGEQPLIYSIESQTVAGAFAIDADSGEITVADGSLIDYETNATHSVTVRVTDEGGLSYDEVFTISIENILEVTQTVPGAQNIDEDQVLTFSTSNANAISVSDTLTNTDSMLQVSLSVNDGFLTLSQTTGLTFVEGSHGSSTFVINGSESDINAALEGMTFTPNTDFNGTVTLDMNTSLSVNLEGHYTFDDGTANDTSAGTVQDGTLVGSATTVSDAEHGEVLSLGGAGDYVQINGLFNGPTDVTLAAWVNLTSSGTNGSEVISLGDSFVLRLDQVDTSALRAFWYNGTTWVNLDFAGLLEGTGWHHVAATFSDSEDTATLYLDGVAVATTTTTDSISYALGSNTTIGVHGNEDPLYAFDGMIDDARIYTDALSAEEIGALAADGVSVSDSVAITVNAINDAPTFEVGDGVAMPDIVALSDGGVDIAVQDDGKYVVLTSANTASSGQDLDFVLSRYNTDGTLDTSFGTNGIVVTAVNTNNESPKTVTLQDDGKILVAGGYAPTATSDSIVMRYNADGTLDTTFSTDGMAEIDFSVTSTDIINDMVVQPDGKIVVVGYGSFSGTNQITVARLHSDGTLDTSFDGDGTLLLPVNGTGSYGNEVELLSDGRIMIGGYADNGTDNDVVLISLNSDGSLDTSFDTDGTLMIDMTASESGSAMVVDESDNIYIAGLSNVSGNSDTIVIKVDDSGSLVTGFGTNGIATHAIGSPYEAVNDMVLQDDGKIIIVGDAYNGSNNDISVIRLNSDGTLDTTFDGDGKIRDDMNGATDSAKAVALDNKGAILVVGNTSIDGSGESFLARFESEGSFDKYFHITNTLDGNPTFIEDGAAVIFDSDVEIFDAELSAVDNFDGATLTLERNGGADAEDTYSSTGTLGALTQSGNLTVGATTIGTVTTNSNGTLVLSFNSNATNDLVNEAMQQITYSNSSDAPPASVQIDWTFSDGVLTGNGDTIVDITAVNDAPVITSSDTINVPENQTAVITVSVTDADMPADTLSYSIIGGVDAAKFSIDSATGELTFQSAPDYENPTDSGGDNVYDVQVQVSDGNGGIDTQAISVTVSPLIGWSISGDASVDEGDNITYTISYTDEGAASVDLTLTDIDTTSADYSNFITAVNDAVASRTDLSFDGTTLSFTPTVITDYSLDYDDTTANFQDISGTGTALGIADDANSLQSIGFNFEFYGITYNQLYINDNGYLTFGGSASEYNIQDFSTGNTIGNLPAIAPMWADFHGGSVNTDDVYIQTVGSAGSQELIIQYNDVVFYDYDNSGATVTLQVVLFEGSNDIEFRYLDVVAGGGYDNGMYSTIGISDGAGDYEQHSYHSASISSGSNIHITAPGTETMENLVISLSITDDGTSEPDEDYSIALSNPTNSVLSLSNSTTTTINGQNVAPIITSDGGGATATVNAAENQTAVTTVTATDADVPANTLTYSIIGGADQTLFSIDENSGALTFNSAQDFEVSIDDNGDGIYEVEVTADDGNSGTDTQTISVTVTDVMELSSASSAALDEDSTFVFSGANVISIDNGLDLDTDIQVTLSVANGTLTLANTTGVTIVEGSDASSSMVIQGQKSDINSALDGLTFTPNTDYSGADTLDISLKITADLEGQYTFDAGTAADDSGGTTHDGELKNGATTITDAPRGEVLSLDGTNDYVQISGEFGQPASITLAAWVNADNGYSEIFSIDNRLILRVDDPNSDRGVAAIYHDGNGYETLASGEWIEDTGWRHVALTFDDPTKTMSLYIDGSLVAQSTFTDSIAYQGGDTYIGSNTGGSLFYNGLIDDARVYTRPLSADEIAALAGYVGDASDSVAITVNALNDAPELQNQPGGGTRFESDTFGTFVDAGVTITDVDSADFDTGVLSVTISSNAEAGDKLQIEDGNGVSVSGANLYYDFGSGAVLIGSVTGGTDHLTPLEVTFNATADATAVEAVAQQVAFLATSDNPTATAREVSMQVTDGDGGTSAVGTRTLNVTPVNDDPFDAGSLPTDITVTEDLSSNIDLSSINLSDLDDNGGDLTVTLMTNTGGNLSAAASAGITISGSGTSTLTLTGALTDLNTYLDDPSNLSYLHATAHTDGNDADTIEVRVNDNGNTGTGGGNDVVLGTVNVDITAVNDAPEGTDATIIVTEDTDYTFTAIDFGYSDIEGDAFDRVWITGLPSQGTLKFDGSIFGAGNFITVADINLGNLTYTPPAGVNGSGIASFDFEVQDDGGTANGGENRDQSANTITIDINPINDAPTIDSTPLTTATEDTLYSYTISASDVDGDSLNYSATTLPTWLTFVDNGDGTATLSGTPTNSEVGDHAVLIEVSDGTLTDTQSFTITVSNTNDAPVFLGTSLINNGTFDTDLSGWTTTGTLESVSGIVRSSENGSSLSQAITTVPGQTYIVKFDFYDASSSKEQSLQVDIDGSTSLLSEEVTSSVSNNTFTSYAYTFVADSTSSTVTFTDTSDTKSGVRAYLDNTIIAQTTTIGGTLSYTENQVPIALYPNLEIADIDHTTLDSATIQISSNYTSGEDLLVFIDQNGITGSWDAATGTLTLSGTAKLNLYQEAIRSIYYENSSDDPNDATRIISLTINDGIVDSAALTTIINITPVNDAPIAVDDTTNGNEDSTINSNVLDNDSDVEGETLSVSLVSDVSNGILTLNPDGSFTYTPDTNFNGVDTFVYEVDDGNGATAQATVTINVTAVNDAPTIDSSYLFSIDENTTNVGTIVASDVDGDSLTYVLSGGPDQSHFTIDPNTGALIFNSAPDFESDNFYEVTVQVSDGNGGTATQAVDVSILDLNEVPIIDSVAITNATEDALYSYTISASDVDGDSLSFSATSVPSWLTLIDHTDGTATLSGTPTNSEVGDHAIVIEVSDGTLTDTQSFTITVANTNDAPTVTSIDLGSIDEDNSRLITQADLLAGASDIDGDSLTAINLSLTTGSGTVTDNGNGTWNFSPSSDWSGAATFDYEVSDGTTSTANTASLTINPVNDAPTDITPDSFTVDEHTDTTTGYSVGTLNTTDVDTGDTFTYTIVGGADAGVFSIGGVGNDELILSDGVLDYESQSSYTIMIRTTDSQGAFYEESVTVSVNDLNDAPIAIDDAITTDEDIPFTSSIDLDANDTDVDGDTLSVVAGTFATAQGGSIMIAADGSYTYTPATNFHGTDSVDYTLTDGTLTDVGTLTITVNPINDIATIVSGESLVTGDEDTIITDTLTITDSADGMSNPNYTISNDGIHGTANIDANTGAWSYTPDSNWHGSDSFVVSVTDDDGNVETHMINITINPVTDLNAGDDSFSVDEDMTLHADVSLNDTTTSGGTLSFVLDSGVSKGSLTFNADGSFSYTPSSNYHGSDSFTYTVSDIDSGESDTRTVTISVNPINDAPTVTNTIADQHALEDAPFSFTLPSNLFDDVDGDTLHFSSDANGWLSFDTSTKTFSGTPTNADVGTSTVTITAHDGNGGTIESTFDIIIENKVNTPAIITGDDTSILQEDINVIGGDIVTSGSLTIEDSDQGENSFIENAITGEYGTLTISTDGTWIYKADNDQKVIQSLGASDTLSDTITVTTVDGTTHDITITIKGNEEVFVESLPDEPETEKEPETEIASKPEEEVESDEEGESEKNERVDIETDIISNPELFYDSGDRVEDESVIVEFTEDTQQELFHKRELENDAFDTPTSKVEQQYALLTSIEANTAMLSALNNPTESESFRSDIEKMYEDIDEAYVEQKRQHELSVAVASGVGVSLTAGFVAWLLRSGSLIASLFAIMPVWRNFDPISILPDTDEQDASSERSADKTKKESDVNQKTETLFDKDK